MVKTQSTIQLVYEPEEKPRSTKDAIIYSLQWIMIMFYPVVWGYSVVGKGLGMTGEEMGMYMVRVVFIIGISTLVQVCAGHKLSMVCGPNIIPSLAIVAAFSWAAKSMRYSLSTPISSRVSSSPFWGHGAHQQDWQRLDAACVRRDDHDGGTHPPAPTGVGLIASQNATLLLSSSVSCSRSSAAICRCAARG